MALQRCKEISREQRLINTAERLWDNAMEWFLVDGNCGFVDGNSTTEPSHRTTQNKEEAIYTRKSDTRLKPSASMPHKLIQRRDPDVIVDGGVAHR
jgi:hypothetical protein